MPSQCNRDKPIRYFGSGYKAAAINRPLRNVNASTTVGYFFPKCEQGCRQTENTALILCTAAYNIMHSAYNENMNTKFIPEKVTIDAPLPFEIARDEKCLFSISNYMYSCRLFYLSFVYVADSNFRKFLPPHS